MEIRLRTGSYLWILVLCSSIVSVVAQESINFKTGQFPLLTPAQDIRQSTGVQYLFYRSDHTLSTGERTQLEQQGIEILYALQNHIYWARVSKVQDALQAKNLFDIHPDYKVGIDINDRSHANRYRLSIAPGMNKEEIISWANANDITLLETRADAYGMIDVEVKEGSFENLKKTPWISFISRIPHDEEINYRAHHGERGWALTSPLTRGLDGTGITIGIGDGGRLGLHDDLKTNITDLTSFGVSNHATQVTGIVTGAGLIDPFYGYGYAPKANVIMRNYSDILLDAPQYISDFGLSITNNSYGTALTDCIYMGDYDGTSAFLDAMIQAHPHLLHVFASGNSGQLPPCVPYSSGFATVVGGYQPAKNLLTVGAINNIDGIAAFSSRGPVDGGRLKPEVVAYGAQRFSTIHNHLYASNSGTSFSSPATAGIAALLYQRYRQLHNDSLPDAALIKNVICNAADDMGNIGPDFIHGFGRINGDRAAAILETSRYFSMSIDHAEVMSTSIQIPSGVAFTDIMLMWTDPPSAPFETVNLVNDLDIAVVTPSGDTIKPWILNYTPSGVASAATMGADHINNYEQITIPTPVSGNYTIVVKGYNVPLGPQKAWISWDINLSGIKVQQPIGGEVYKPGNINLPDDRQYFRWDAYGTGSSTFTAAYSINGGNTWTTIASGLASNRRWVDWFPPNTPTDQLKVRITASNGMEDVSDSTAILMAAPESLSASSPCDGYVQLSWNAVTGADYYRAYSIKNEMLYAIDTTSATSIVLSGFPPDSAIWITVSAVFPSGINGLRARAIAVTANGGNNCSWNHDLRIDSLMDLSSGRMLTSTALTSGEPVTIRIHNAGTLTASGFSLAYSINHGTPISELFPGNLAAGTGQDFTFTNTADLSAQGVYDLRVWLSYPSDPFPQNDTIEELIHHLSNPVITLPWVESFENMPETTISSTTTGLPGLQQMDISMQSNARVRSFSGSPFCHDGERSLTVDAIRTGSNTNADLLLTLNLSSYTVAEDDVRLNVHVMHHEIFPETSNNESIWIRGSDTSVFVLLTAISNDASLRGQWQLLAGLDLTTVLDNAGQDFSASFQIRFAHGVYASAGQLTSQDGQTIDDLSIHIVERDIAVEGILQPSSIACDLGLDTVKISIINTSTIAVNNTTAFYQLNEGTPQATYIGTIPAASTMIVSLLPPADFSVTGAHKLKVWVSSVEDDFQFNDTMETVVLHTPLVSSFPYLEGFETGDGGWVAGGRRSSWAFGQPGKQIINRAAEGQKVWATSLYGNHNADETSYLYSPCFDLHDLVQPYLSFGLQFQLEVGYDYAWVEYRIEGSTEWVKMGSQGSGVSWYNHTTNAWNGNQVQWITSGHAIPVMDTVVQFRWVFQSDTGVELEGLAIDQVHVYDSIPLYTGVDMQWTIPVSGNEWTHIEQGGQRVFSIHPQGQDLGDVTLSIYNAVNNFHLSDSLYLLSRNWVLTSTMAPTSEIKLRGYFTKDEATNLVNASGCALCISARDGFEVAALRYSGPGEDGSYDNNEPAQVFTYSLDSTDVVPFDNGYYAQWETQELSEWWITSPVTKWAGTLERRISSAYDDAEEHQDNGAVNPTREKLALVAKNGNQKIGWRFKNITIPPGSYISSAFLEWTSSDTSSSPASWILQSQMIADAPAFITGKYNLSLRQRSNQVVQWIPAAWTNVNSVFVSPDIRHLIQQVVDQPTWMNGHDIALLMRGTGFREAWSYDGDPLKGAKLIITYDSLCTSAGICYVDSNASGIQNGSSWEHAYRSLEQALDHAIHCPDITEIWMAGGTYTPYAEVSRSSWYTVPSGLTIYGGFEGTESAIEQRIYGAYPTILSGDIGIAGSDADNLYHVITILSGVDGSMMDGITIRKGLADGTSIDLQRGSGVNNLGKLTVNQVIIEMCSPQPVYNSPGAILTVNSTTEIKQ